MYKPEVQLSNAEKFVAEVFYNESAIEPGLGEDYHSVLKSFLDFGVEIHGSYEALTEETDRTWLASNGINLDNIYYK